MKGTTVGISKLAAALVGALVATGAHAGPGNGLRLGGSDARLHPFFDFEARYDSNVSYDTRQNEVGDVILHVKPGLELKAPGDLAAVEFSGALDWAQYLGAEGDTSDLSKLYANAAFAALFNRKGAVSARVDNTFLRRISATSLSAVGAAVISNVNVLSLAVPWRPGGGALVATASASWTLESFQEYKDPPPVPVSDLGYSQFRGGGELQWRFLPRTSALLSAGYYQRVPNASDRPDEGSGFDVLAGFTGLLMPRVAATAKVGFGNASAKSGPNGESESTGSVLADVSGEWLPLDTVSFRVGYTRGLGLDPTVSTFITDGVSGGVRVKIADRVAARLNARWDRLTFEAVPGGADTSYFQLDPAVEGKFGEWLNAAVGYLYTTRSADFPSGFGGAQRDFSKSEAYVRVGVTY